MERELYEVVSDKVSIGGVEHKKGDVVEAVPKSAHILAALHFGQIRKKSRDPEPINEPASEAPAEEETSVQTEKPKGKGTK